MCLARSQETWRKPLVAIVLSAQMSCVNVLAGYTFVVARVAEGIFQPPFGFIQ